MENFENVENFEKFENFENFEYYENFENFKKFANHFLLALFDNVKLAKMSFYSLLISKSKHTVILYSQYGEIPMWRMLKTIYKVIFMFSLISKISWFYKLLYFFHYLIMSN